jgi:hypothetical protein
VNIINFFVLGIIAFLLIFIIQLALCFKAKRLAVKLIPVYFVIALFILAGLVAVSDNAGSLLDLRGFVAKIISGFALGCGISIGTAWQIYKYKRNKKDE